MGNDDKPDVNETTGTVVSTNPERGHFCTRDFDTDNQAVQHAYDNMVTTPDLPSTLILDAPDRPFAFHGPLDIWQSSSRVTSTGGVSLTPAENYEGPLIQSGMRPETKVGEDGVISNVVIDHIWLNGNNRSLGIKLRDLQLSTIHDIHIRKTAGAGLHVSDGCIENLFSNLILSDECGSETQPALLIEPESVTRKPDINDLNLTVNSTYFSGIMIHFPTRDALRISAGPMEPSECRGHRKIQFNGCFFHAHPRNEKPLVTISDAYELNFVGTQMLTWNDEGVVMQLGTEDDCLPTGITMISHCIFGSKPNAKTIGIQMKNVDTDAPCASFFGNSFGSRDKNRLGTAVDWGQQAGKSAAWAGNTVCVSNEPHIGTLPQNADVSPFE